MVAEQSAPAAPPTTRTAGRWRVPVLVLAGVVTAKLVNTVSFAVADAMSPVAPGLDPQGAWAYITVHHLVQLAIVLAVMGLVVATTPMTFARFGFTTHDWRWSLRVVAVFAAVWTVIQLGVGWLVVSNGASAEPGFPLDRGSLVGRFVFELLLTGSSEEPLYRGLIMTGLIVGLAPALRARRSLAVAAIGGSTLAFMLDHINVDWSSLTITHVNGYQQATLLVFGIVYGLLFWRTRSLVGPIVAHGVLNVVITGSGLVLYALAG